MPGSDAPSTPPSGSEVDRELIGRLTAISRGSASDGERLAAEMVRDALEAIGVPAEIDVERVAGRGFWWPMGLLGVASAAAAVATLAGRRREGLVLAALTSAVVVDDLDGGRRWFRRALMPRRASFTVVGRLGPPDAERILVVLAHHDAPRTGLVFHPGPQRWIWERWPAIVERTNRSPPVWAPVAAAPLAVAAGALAQSRRLTVAGLTLSLGLISLMADIARSPVVPGANDNASGVGALAGVGEALVDHPPASLAVWLVSCGSEESMQTGIRAFLARHGADLPRDRTSFVNLETVGSPELVMLEGEGTLVMRTYRPEFTDRVEAVAHRAGVPVRRGLRASTSTDSITAHRAGYPVATLTSLTAWKALANYHWPTDTADRLDYGTIKQATRVVVALARDLDAGPGRAT